jgi:hypothetical protein
MRAGLPRGLEPFGMVGGLRRGLAKEAIGGLPRRPIDESCSSGCGLWFGSSPPGDILPRDMVSGDIAFGLRRSPTTMFSPAYGSVAYDSGNP